MATGIVAKRYAQAVFELALERGELDKWQSDLEEMSAAAEDPQLVALLENTKIPLGRKLELVKDSLPGLGPLAINLAYLLITKGRFRIAPHIATEYQGLVYDYQGIGHAQVTTAVPLDKVEEEKLAQRLSAITGKHILLSIQVDPELIGGLTARVGDTLIDGSTRSKLLALKKSLVGTPR